MSVDRKEEYKLQRRVAGYHDIRLDGVTDIVLRAKGQRVLDLGCNRGLIGFELANNGATVVHGCDIFDPGIQCARELFIDLRSVEGRFEIVDLTSQIPFPGQHYDIILCIATYHKLKRLVTPAEMSKIVNGWANRCDKWFVWRGPGDKPAEADEEMAQLDKDLAGMERIHTSRISKTLGVAAIWEKA